MNSVLSRFITHEYSATTAAVAAVAADGGKHTATCAAEVPQDAPHQLSPEARVIADAYLDHLGESDPITRAEYIDGLARDPERYANHCRAVVDAGIASQPSTA